MTTSVRLLALHLALLLSLGTQCSAALYFNGFETDTAGWNVFGGSFDATRVPSGTNGITSATGSYHAENSTSGSAGNWGGYNFGAGNAVPTAFQQYLTSVSIYLDVSGSWANDTRFDFSSAINNSGGTHRRDFIFNGGFYNDATGPGANTNRFVISASNNSQPGSAFAKNPGRDPIAISATGWYTFEHQFYNNGGVLAVDLNIYDSSNSLVHSWTLSDPGDVISAIGGNRYGWFDYNQFSVLAFDNAQLVLSAVPETSAFIGLGLIGAAIATGNVLRKKIAPKKALE